MVAVSGTGWQLAPSLVALINETDRRFPGRDHSSDGSIGDADHQSRASDHNPDQGYVHAVDVDEDLSPTLHSLRYLRDYIVDQRDHRVRYLIYEREITKSYVDSSGRPAWVAQPYTGSNPHDKHMHVSVRHTDAARNDTGPWWPGSDQEDDMPTEAQTEAIVRKVLNEGTAVGYQDWQQTNEGIVQLLRDLSDKVSVLSAQVDNIAVGGVDEAALAEGVADELAERLDE